MSADTVNVNGKAKADYTYDAIVIGSGISGGWAAKELTERGLKTIMLERGRNFEHLKDYKSAAKDPWEFEHRGDVTQDQRKVRPVISRGWGATEPIMDYWANEQDAPRATRINPWRPAVGEKDYENRAMVDRAASGVAVGTLCSSAGRSTINAAAGSEFGGGSLPSRA